MLDVQKQVVESRTRLAHRKQCIHGVDVVCRGKHGIEGRRGDRRKLAENDV